MLTHLRRMNAKERNEKKKKGRESQEHRRIEVCGIILENCLLLHDIVRGEADTHTSSMNISNAAEKPCQTTSSRLVFRTVCSAMAKVSAALCEISIPLGLPEEPEV